MYKILGPIPEQADASVGAILPTPLLSQWVLSLVHAASRRDQRLCRPKPMYIRICCSVLHMTSGLALCRCGRWTGNCCSSMHCPLSRPTATQQRRSCELWIWMSSCQAPWVPLQNCWGVQGSHDVPSELAGAKHIHSNRQYRQNPATLILPQMPGC